MPVVTSGPTSGLVPVPVPSAQRPRVRRSASHLPSNRSVRGIAPAPLRGGRTASSTSVRLAPRWAGSGPAHWHNGPVTVRSVRPVAAPTNLATVRSRGMYGY